MSAVRFVDVPVFVITFLAAGVMAATQFCSPTSSAGTLRQLTVMFRNGDSGPVTTFPSLGKRLPSIAGAYWPHGDGNLQAQGVTRQYEFGRWVRTCYDGLLPAVFNQETVHVRSLETDRTLSSATIHMAGAYPANGKVKGLYWDSPPNAQLGKVFWPVPIHTVPKSRDFLLDMWRVCPRLKAQSESLWASDPEIGRIRHEKRELLKNLSIWTGSNSLSIFYNAVFVYEPLKVMKLNGVPLPAWCTDDVFEELKRWRELQNNIFFAHDQKSAVLNTGLVLKEIISRLGKMANNQSLPYDTSDVNVTPYTHMVYSTHEVTLTGLLTQLNAYDGELPPYASAVLFELHETSTGDDGWRLHAYYRKDNTSTPREIELPGCNSSSPSPVGGKGGCPIRSVIEATADDVIHNLAVECGFRAEHPSGWSQEMIVMLCTMVSVATLIVVCVVSLVDPRHRLRKQSNASEALPGKSVGRVAPSTLKTPSVARGLKSASSHRGQWSEFSHQRSLRNTSSTAGHTTRWAITRESELAFQTTLRDTESVNCQDVETANEVTSRPASTIGMQNAENLPAGSILGPRDTELATSNRQTQTTMTGLPMRYKDSVDRSRASNNAGKRIGGSFLESQMQQRLSRKSMRSQEDQEDHDQLKTSYDPGSQLSGRFSFLS